MMAATEIDVWRGPIIIARGWWLYALAVVSALAYAGGALILWAPHYTATAIVTVDTQFYSTGAVSEFLSIAEHLRITNSGPRLVSVSVNASDPVEAADLITTAIERANLRMVPKIPALAVVSAYYPRQGVTEITGPDDAAEVAASLRGEIVIAELLGPALVSKSRFEWQTSFIALLLALATTITVGLFIAEAWRNRQASIRPDA